MLGERFLKPITFAVIIFFAVSTDSSAVSDGCAAVSATPDGFLAVRTGPGTSFREISRLGVGQLISTGGYFGDPPHRWVNVKALLKRTSSGKLHAAEAVEGWVFGRYLSATPCHDVVHKPKTVEPVHMMVVVFDAVAGRDRSLHSVRVPASTCLFSVRRHQEIGPYVLTIHPLDRVGDPITGRALEIQCVTQSGSVIGTRSVPISSAPSAKRFTNPADDLLGPRLPQWGIQRPAMPTRYSGNDLQPKELFAAVAPSVYVLLAGPSSDLTKGGSGALGSAVAVAENFAITNCHLVKENPFIALIDDDTDQVFAAVVASADERSDRCFLSVQGKLRAIAQVRTVGSLAVGERVYTIGNPSGLSKTLAEGLISGLRTRDGVNYVQTSAPISRGSSGGALVDAKGALVGVTTFLLKDAQNLNFAIAAEEFWR